ncbi:MAG TPA: hypothetical protein ENI48_13485 [Thioploca sp.]|nr:hypothetical protein [Thioploca sp.]
MRKKKLIIITVMVLSVVIGFSAWWYWSTKPAEERLERVDTWTKAGNVEAAMSELNAILELWILPNDIKEKALAIRMHIHSDIGNRSDAIADAQELVTSPTLDPLVQAQVLGSLGWWHYEENDLSRSELASRQALGLAPNQVWVRANLALVLLLKGAIDEAINEYQIAVKLIDNPVDIDRVILADVEAARKKSPQLAGVDKVIQIAMSRHNELKSKCKPILDSAYMSAYLPDVNFTSCIMIAKGYDEYCTCLNLEGTNGYSTCYAERKKEIEQCGEILKMKMMGRILRP